MAATPSGWGGNEELGKIVSGVFPIGFLTLFAASAFAQQYIFTNDNVANSNNSTTALTVTSDWRIEGAHDLPHGREERGQRLLRAFAGNLCQEPTWKLSLSSRMVETAASAHFR